MLSDSVLEDLTRHTYTPVQEALVTAAWPSLSVESKLQVIQRVAPGGLLGNSPAWLTRLALSDEHAIVRFWCARHARFEWVPQDGQEDPIPERRCEPEERELTLRVRNDDSELVRACESWCDAWQLEGLEKYPRLTRLLAIRRVDRPSLYSFVKWLVAVVKERSVPANELLELAEEFFMHPYVRRCYLSGEDGFYASVRDDTLQYEDQKALDAAWKLAADCGEHLSNLLAKTLPTSLGHARIPVDQFLELPPKALERVLYRDETEWAVSELRQKVRESPEKFDEVVVKAEECLREEAEEQKLELRRVVLTAEQKAHRELVIAHAQQKEQLEALQAQVKELQRFIGEQFVALAGVVRERRGFFS